MDPRRLPEQVDLITAWVAGGPIALIERWEPQRLPAITDLCSDLRRFAAADRAELAICFLGNSGVGKSTLINSVIDPRLQIVPQGGIGPLTAQATVVRYSAAPYLHATYHGPRRVNQLVFALDRYCERQRGIARQSSGALDAADERELEFGLPPTDESGTEPGDASLHGRIRSYVGQAKQLVTGRQFGGDELPIEYLADALRSALGNRPRWGYSLLPEHVTFAEQLVDAIALGDQGLRRDGTDDEQGFFAEVARHASGSIAPLIRSLEVGWPAASLRDGLVLVDLPGIGIANDEYRSVTSAWIRKATAVVLVVDKSGVTDASADLLRTTGFLNSILHRSPESTTVSPLLRVVAVKLDDVATAERAALRTRNPGAPPAPWLTVFRSACDRSQELIRNQLAQVFDQSVSEAPAETQPARRDALEQIVSSLVVYPVSAIEYRKLCDEDPEDPAKIKLPEDSGIPALIDSLNGLAQQHRSELVDGYRAAAKRLFDTIDRALTTVTEELSGDERQVAHLAELRSSLDRAVGPAANSLKPRLGALRERLRGTIPQAIETEVERTVAVADRKVREYFVSLHRLPWGTLRATIRRGGVWVRARPVDLPNELALRFEEPLAVAWQRGVVAPLTKALDEFGTDVGRLLGQVILWARAHAGLESAHIQRFESEAEEEVKSLVSRKRLAAADLTTLAKQHLHDGIQEEIRTACQQFMDDGRHVGAGVMKRMHEFLDHELAPRVAQVARATAAQFFRASYDTVLGQVVSGLQRFNDPLEYASALLLGGQERAAQAAAPRVDELVQARAILAQLVGLQAEVEV
jgi:GTP-binding protein EngB required for normal cell division